jgi:hypothetical protein
MQIDEIYEQKLADAVARTERDLDAEAASRASTDPDQARDVEPCWLGESRRS